MPERKKRNEVETQSQQAADEEVPRPRAMWSGTIGFGLVSIPVNLFPANRPRQISLRMLGPDGAPLSRRYYEPETGKEVGNEDLVRGYEISKDEYVIVEDEELEALAPKKSRDIELTQFVDASQIDPMLFERAYFLVPSGSSNKAYRLLAETMERTKRAGIATFVMREKEYLVAVLAENGILRAETLRFADEIRSPEDIGLPEEHEPAKDDIRAFVSQIEHHSSPSLDPRKLRDEQAARLIELAQRKLKHGEQVVRIEAEAKGGKDNVIDLMAVLKRSLRTGGGEAVSDSEFRETPRRPKKSRAAGTSPKRSRPTARIPAARRGAPRGRPSNEATARRASRSRAQRGGKGSRAAR